MSASVDLALTMITGMQMVGKSSLILAFTCGAHEQQAQI